MERGRGLTFGLRSTDGSCDRGRAGSMGGWSSSRLSELPLGGVLNGESFSAMMRLDGGEPLGGGASDLAGCGMNGVKCCDGILGLSVRLMGGGAALGGGSFCWSRWSRSRFNSADRRGGGGDGGCDGDKRGDLRESVVDGVCGRLGTLGRRGDEEGERGALLATESGLRKKLDWSVPDGARLPARPMGGECGGCTSKDGGAMGRGLSGGGGPSRFEGRRKAGDVPLLRLKPSETVLGESAEEAVREADEFWPVTAGEREGAAGVGAVNVVVEEGSRGFGFVGGGSAPKGRSPTTGERMGDAGPRSRSGFDAGEMGRLRGAGKGDG